MMFAIIILVFLLIPAYLFYSATKSLGQTNFFIEKNTLVERMTPSLNDGVQPSQHRPTQPSSGQAKLVTNITVRNPSFQSAFIPIETIPYFLKRLTVF